MNQFGDGEGGAPPWGEAPDRLISSIMTLTY